MSDLSKTSTKYDISTLKDSVLDKNIWPEHSKRDLIRKSLRVVVKFILAQYYSHFRTPKTQTIGIYSLEWHTTVRILVDIPIINKLLGFALNRLKSYVVSYEENCETRG